MIWLICNDCWDLTYKPQLSYQYEKYDHCVGEICYLMDSIFVLASSHTKQKEVLLVVLRFHIFRTK